MDDGRWLHSQAETLADPRKLTEIVTVAKANFASDDGVSVLSLAQLANQLPRGEPHLLHPVARGAGAARRRCVVRPLMFDMAAPRPSDPVRRAVHALHLLREWRGSAHVAAVTALALNPLDAIMLNGGPAYAEFYQWPQPGGNGGGRQQLSTHAEELTDAQCAPVFERALTPFERGELAELLATAAHTAAALT